MTPAHPDGILRRVSDRTWAGTLHGYRVLVFWCGGTWCYAVINPQGHTEVCPRVQSFAEGARRARERIEQNARSVAAIYWLGSPVQLVDPRRGQVLEQIVCDDW